MEKLSIKDMVRFRGKSEKAKKNYAEALKVGKKENDSDGGGDYWISCLSAISNSYKSNNPQFIKDKKEELLAKIKETGYDKTKQMYRRNISVLSDYENYDHNKLVPKKKITFLKQYQPNFLLPIKGFHLQVKPHHVFTFEVNKKAKVGAIWFVAKLGGLKREELGMFCDILFRYLKAHYSNDFEVSLKYCIAVYVNKAQEIRYSELKNEQVSKVLDNTLNELKKLM
jgi:hypothetical protein